MTVRDRIVLDAAGGGIGGAARWAVELDGFLARGEAPVEVLGRRRRLTPAWLLRRERRAAGARIAVAANNVSFALGAAERRVVLRNALHFLYPSEQHLLAAVPPGFRAQIPVVRRLLARADTIVAPSSAMAGRVAHALPAVRHRLVVRPHPVTPVGGRSPAAVPFVLVPVLPAGYKNLLPQLAALLAALDRRREPTGVRVTVRAADLPGRLAAHPRLTPVGTLPHAALAALWQHATAAFFPSTVEAFGYPLAEARAYGVPVLSPDTPQAHEIAGPALLPYRPGDPDSLAAALDRLREPVPAEPHPFDRDSYFRWLFALPPAHPRPQAEECHDLAS